MDQSRKSRLGSAYLAALLSKETVFKDVRQFIEGPLSILSSIAYKDNVNYNYLMLRNESHIPARGLIALALVLSSVTTAFAKEPEMPSPDDKAEGLLEKRYDVKTLSLKEFSTKQIPIKRAKGFDSSAASSLAGRQAFGFSKTTTPSEFKTSKQFRTFESPLGKREQSSFSAQQQFEATKAAPFRADAAYRDSTKHSALDGKVYRGREAQLLKDTSNRLRDSMTPKGEGTLSPEKIREIINEDTGSSSRPAATGAKSGSGR